MPKPPMTAALTWQNELIFTTSSAGASMTLDSEGVAGPSPVQTLAFSIAGCMGMDVVDILRKGRHPLRGLEVQFVGHRAEEPPRRFVAIQLSFVVRGAIPADAVTRAIALSREKYCSVSNSLRADLEIVTSYEVQP